jgi:hypothetical protein
MSSFMTWIQGKKTYTTVVVIAILVILKMIFGVEVPDLLIESLLGFGLITSKIGVKAAAEKVIEATKSS